MVKNLQATQGRVDSISAASAAKSFQLCLTQ